MSRYQKYGRAFSLVLFVSLSAAPALAASRPAQEKAARKACLSGDYAQGVSILSELFVSSKNPTYLFNQGRCYEQNRKYEEAIARFEEYSRLVDKGEFKAKASDREQAEKHIQKCKESLAEQEARNQVVPQAFVPPTTTVAPLPEIPAPAPIVVPPKPQPAPEAHGGSGLLIGGIVTATLGAGALGAGVLLNMKANHTRDDMQNNLNGYSSGKESDRKNYVLLSRIGYGVGAACVVTGAILIGYGVHGGGGKSSDVALLPTVGNGQAGVMLSGGF